jgi:hypothetical protein
LFFLYIYRKEKIGYLKLYFLAVGRDAALSSRYSVSPKCWISDTSQEERKK